MVENDKTAFPIVGIGSSAGGLKVLEAFFTHMAREGLKLEPAAAIRKAAAQKNRFTAVGCRSGVTV